jgi:hypothetical protein
MTLFVKFPNLNCSAVCNVCIRSNPFTAYSMPPVFGQLMIEVAFSHSAEAKSQKLKKLQP